MMTGPKLPKKVALSGDARKVSPETEPVLPDARWEPSPDFRQKKKRALRTGPALQSPESVCVQREVVCHKRSLQRRVFRPQEVDPYGLALVGRDVERFLRVSSGLVQV